MKSANELGSIDGESIYAVPGNPAYCLTKTGKVYSRYRRNGKGLSNTWKELKSFLRNGYSSVKLGGANGTQYSVHFLVLSTFVEQPAEACVRFKDGNKLNCCLDNLYWKVAEYKEDLSGRRFGRLVVQKTYAIVTHELSETYKWDCMCDCGATYQAFAQQLLGKICVECRECSRISTAKHGMCGTPEYNSWTSMKQRCTNPNATSYTEYGERGIKVCDRWLDSFENFLADMGLKPGPNYSLDRNNTNGEYCPENCSWEIKKDQQNNRRNTKYLTLNGVKLSLMDWSRKLNLPRAVLWSRINGGWSDEQVLTTPVWKK